MSPSEAAKEINELDHESDNLKWKEVEKADNTNQPLLKRLLENYLSEFPQGIHSDEANAKLTKIKIGGKKKKDLARLEELKTEFEGLKKQYGTSLKNGGKNMLEMRNSVNKFIAKTQSMANISDTQGKLELLITRSISLKSNINLNISKKETIDNWSETFDSDVKQAGLDLLKMDRAVHGKLYEQFRTKASTKIIAEAKRQYKDGEDWKSALDYLSLILSTRIKQMIEEKDIPHLDEKVKYYERLGDKMLYEIFLRKAKNNYSKSASKYAHNYLDESPLQAMRDNVVNWTKYVKILKSEQTYRIGIKSIKWSDQASVAEKGKGDAYMIFQVDDSKVERYNFMAENIPGRQIFPDNQMPFILLKNIKAHDSIEFHMKFFDKDDGWFNDDDSYGSYNDRRSFLDNINGKLVTLVNSENYGGSKVKIVIKREDKNGDWKEFKRPKLSEWVKPR